MSRFKIVCRTRDDDSYLYSDTTTTWDIIEVSSGKVVRSFIGRTFFDAAKSELTGASKVTLEEGNTLKVVGHDGSTTVVQL